MNLTRQLLAVESSRLIQIAQTQPEIEYSFRHALAGEAAASMAANAEACMHFAATLKSLEQLPDSHDNRTRRVDIIIKYVAASFITEPEQNLAWLGEAEKLLSADAVPDRLRLAHVHYLAGYENVVLNRMGKALPYLQKVLSVAQETNDEELLVLPSIIIGRMMFCQGRFAESFEIQTQTLAPFEKAANWVEWMLTLSFIGLALAARGQVSAGVANIKRALAHARELNNKSGIGTGHITHAIVIFLAGDMPHVIEASRDGMAAVEQSGDQLVLVHGHAFSAWAKSRSGNHAAAAQHMTQSKRIGERMGGRPFPGDWFAAAEAELALNAGRADETIALAQTALDIAHRVWGVAFSRLDAPNYDQAILRMVESLRAFESGEALLEVAQTHMAWGVICHEQGTVAEARGHFEKAATQFESSGLTDLLEHMHTQLAQMGTA